MPIPGEIKIEMLGLVQDMGLKLTTLEHRAWTYDAGKPKVKQLRLALEEVRHLLALTPESDPLPPQDTDRERRESTGD